MPVWLLAACSVPAIGWDSDRPPDSTPRDPLWSVQGHVLDEQGLPIEGAAVQTDPHGYLVESGADGGFSITRLPGGDYELVVADHERSTTRTPFSLEGDLEGLEVVLPWQPELDGSLRISVLGPGGEAWEGAQVMASEGSEATTDEDGVAWLWGLGGQEVSLTVSDEGLWPYAVTGLQVPEVGALQLTTTLAGQPAEDAVFVGSRICLACHYETVAQWQSTAHAQAFAPELQEPIVGHFEAGAEVPLPDAHATLWMDGEQPTVTLVDDSGTTRDFAVSGQLGWEEGGSALLTDIEGDSWPLPLVWRAEDPARGPDGEAMLLAWQTERWLDEGELLPEPAGLRAEDSCLACHTTGFDQGEWLEEGVGCESCHGAGSSHIAAPEPHKARNITRPDHLDDRRANAVCAQCHSALENHMGQPWPLAEDGSTFQPGQPLDAFGSSVPQLWASGNASAPGQQADELGSSPHGADPTLRCFDCHDPHGGGETEHASLRLESRDNTLCEACHEGHPEHADQPCTGCHMPATSARLGFGDFTGAGDRSSHLFLPVSPQVTLDGFDDEGEQELEIGRAHV